MKKAIKKSIEALRKIRQDYPSCHKQILELLALLHNIHSRIEVMEADVTSPGDISKSRLIELVEERS